MNPLLRYIPRPPAPRRFLIREFLAMITMLVAAVVLLVVLP